MIYKIPSYKREWVYGQSTFSLTPLHEQRKLITLIFTKLLVKEWILGLGCIISQETKGNSDISLEVKKDSSKAHSQRIFSDQIVSPKKKKKKVLGWFYN